MKKSKSNKSKVFRKGLVFERLDERELMAVDSQPLKDINTDVDYYPAFYLVNQIVQAGNVGYYAFEDPVHGKELWRTDGTREGTRMEADLLSGSQSSNPRQLIALGESLLFIADTEDSQLALYSLGPHDSTPVVLRIWENIAPASSFLVFDELAYFTAIDKNGVAGLWITDGNRLTQASLPDNVAISVDQYLVRVGDRVLFRSVSYSGSYNETPLIVSYDTRTDKSQIIFSGYAEIHPFAQDTVLIRTYTEAYRERIWLSDGTITGTKSVENSESWNWGWFPAAVEVEHGWVTILRAPNYRYKSLVSISRDGVVRPILKLENMNEISNVLVAVNGMAVLFSPGNASYITNGSKVENLYFDSPVLNDATSFFQAVVWNGKLVATVYNDFSSALLTLDVVDRTVQVVANMQNSSSAGDPWLLDFADPNRLVIYEPAKQSLKQWNGSELLAINGEVGRIAPGTMLGSSYVTMIATSQGVYPARLDSELIPLSKAIVLPNLSGLTSNESVVWNDQVFFLATGANGLDLWRTDGTSEGTIRLLKDIGSNVRLVAMDSRVLAIRETVDGFQVWESNGDSNGSRLIGTTPFREFTWVASTGDKIIVSDSFGLWSYDLNEWTRIFKTERIGNFSISPPTQFGNKVIFRVWEGAWTEDGVYESSQLYWQTDGTIEGTIKLPFDPMYSIDRIVTDGDWSFFTSNNTVYKTRDRFLSIETVVELSGIIVDLAIFDHQLYVLQTNEVLDRLSLMKWSPESKSMIRLADYSWSCTNSYSRDRFFETDSALYVESHGFHSESPIIQRIDTRTDLVHTIPALNLFASANSWSPKALSIGVVGPARGSMIGEELFIVHWEDLEEIDDSIPLNILIDSDHVPENAPLNTPFAWLSTMAQVPGVYRYEFVEGGNDNANFEIVGDRLINRIPFDRNTQVQFDLDIRTISNSGASGVFRVTFFVVPPDEPPQAIDDRCVVWPGQFCVINPLENDLAGTNSMDGAMVQFVSSAALGGWEIRDNLVVFTPSIDFVGSNKIQYVVIDRKGNVSLPATIEVRVNSHFQNLEKPVDVDRDGQVGALDVLTIINQLNDSGTQFLDQTSVGEETIFIDVDGDGIVSPNDALAIINWINSEWDDAVSEGDLDIENRSIDKTLDTPCSSDEIYHDIYFRLFEEELVTQRTRRLLSHSGSSHRGDAMFV